jgi:general secretion pathway protein D
VTRSQQNFQTSGCSITWGGTGGATSIQAVVTALQSVTNVRVISSPYLSVVDGATSRLNAGDQIPFVIASQTSQSGGQVTVTQEIETRDVGVILNVTRRISPDNSVMLDIVQEVSSARSSQTVAGANPVISQRRVQSQIVVQSGGTVLLGGLIQERTDTGENGMPVLRRIPGVGTLFNRTDNTTARSELWVLITPRVVRNADTLDSLTRQLRLHVARR